MLLSPQLYGHKEANDDTQRRSGGGVKGDRTRTLISERKRRSGMKEKLYALRALVPYITKLYGHKEANDGICINNDNASGTSDGIGCYDAFDPNLDFTWDQNEDDVKVLGDDDSSETMTTRNPDTQRRSGGGVKGDRTRTLISERKRRSGMKEKLYALRALVPYITKGIADSKFSKSVSGMKSGWNMLKFILLKWSIEYSKEFISVNLI
nr:Myc-type, basic helix-loop-helix (bHLH) domain-containing protein [Tanacetum cinerariifolium]